jgi:hypothetical protein
MLILRDLTLKTLFDFRHQLYVASLRVKYQHFGLNLVNFKISQFSVKKYEKIGEILILRGSKLTWKAKNPIFIAIIFKFE